MGMDDKKKNYDIPISSKTRSIFFAVHLFRQQIFSMSVHLEYWLSAFLYLHCNMDQENDNNDNGHIKKTNFVELLQEITKNKHNKNDKNVEKIRYYKILK